jgi:hypothetical protein
MEIDHILTTHLSERAEADFLCTAVMKGTFKGEKLKDVDTEFFLLVDPQGYSYPRYVGLSIHYVRSNQRIGKDYHTLISNVSEQMEKIKTPGRHRT